MGLRESLSAMFSGYDTGCNSQAESNMFTIYFIVGLIWAIYVAAKNSDFLKGQSLLLKFLFVGAIVLNVVFWPIMMMFAFAAKKD